MWGWSTGSSLLWAEHPWKLLLWVHSGYQHSPDPLWISSSSLQNWISIRILNTCRWHHLMLSLHDIEKWSSICTFFAWNRRGTCVLKNSDLWWGPDSGVLSLEASKESVHAYLVQVHVLMSEDQKKKRNKRKRNTLWVTSIAIESHYFWILN